MSAQWGGKVAATDGRAALASAYLARLGNAARVAPKRWMPKMNGMIAMSKRA